MNDYFGISQGPSHQHHHAWIYLLHALYRFFLPLNDVCYRHQKEVFYLKNLDIGGCTWSMCQVLLWLVIYTVNINLSFFIHKGHPPHSKEDRCQQVALGIWLAEIYGYHIPWNMGNIHPYTGSPTPCKWETGNSDQGHPSVSGRFLLSVIGFGVAQDTMIQTSEDPPHPGWIQQCLRVNVWRCHPPCTHGSPTGPVSTA